MSSAFDHGSKMKRVLTDEDAVSPAITKNARLGDDVPTSEAAKFNETIIRRLQKALMADPGADLLAIFPSGYSARLAGLRDPVPVCENRSLERRDGSPEKMPRFRDACIGNTQDEPPNQVLETRTLAAGMELPLTSSAAVVLPLSEPVQGLLGINAIELSESCPSLWDKLYKVINGSEVIWQNGASGGVAVLRCCANRVIKIVPNLEDYTEFTTLKFVRRHAEGIPVPEPLGVIRSEKMAFLFMSFIAGPTLEEVWSQLPKEQKYSLSNQLSSMLLRLRELKFPNGGELGGVSGERCKDSRRHTRISQKPVRSIAEFEDFVFSNPHFGGSVYIELLRSMSQSRTPSIVFTHGDLRPANIIVQPDQQGVYSIRGILDWEMSGFYPDYWESVKATNTMAPQEEDDWYLHLPACASPSTYPLNWLLDRKWDVHLA